MEGIIIKKKKGKSSKTKNVSDPQSKQTILIRELTTVITPYMNKKLVTAGITYEMLSQAFQKSQETGIKKLLTGDKDEAMTKNKRISKTISSHFYERMNVINKN